VGAGRDPQGAGVAQVIARRRPGVLRAIRRRASAIAGSAHAAGRELAAERKLGEAREQFREAEKLAKSDPQAAYAIGLLSLQLEDYLEAQVAFTRALKQGYREPTSIYLGLGQAAEGLKRYEEAIGWYQKVEAGDWVRAQLKIATLIARQQGLAAGREYLQRIEARTEDDSIQMIQVEAQLLRDAKEWNETYQMLSKAVAKYRIRSSCSTTARWPPNAWTASTCSRPTCARSSR
jgi:tetratricopeptide (TPR) repeat protein